MNKRNASDSSDSISARALKRLRIRAESSLGTEVPALSEEGSNAALSRRRLRDEIDETDESRKKHKIADSRDVDHEIKLAFERGLIEGHSQFIKLVPEALLEVERETRNSCTLEAEEDGRAWCRMRDLNPFGNFGYSVSSMSNNSPYFMQLPDAPYFTPTRGALRVNLAQFPYQGL